MEINKTIHLAYSYIKYKIGRTLLTLFILTFSILGFILTNQITALYKSANIEITGINNGYHDFALNYPSGESLKSLASDRKVSKVGNEWVIGSGKSQYSPSVLIFRDKAYHEIDLSLSFIQEGKYPTAENEIAVSKAFADQYKLAIGDILDIEFSKYDSETGVELYTGNKNFTITGMADSPAYAFEACLVSSALKDSYGIGTENSLVVLNNPKNVTEQIDEIVSEYNINPAAISMNQNMLSAREDNQNVQIFKYIMNILIFITFGLVIYNLLYFDSLSKTKDFGILRCIGHQSSQLALVIIIQTTIYVFISFVLAFFIAIAFNSLLAKVIIRLVSDQSGASLSGFHAQINIGVFVQSLLLIIVTVIPSLAGPIVSLQRISPKIAMSYSKEMGNIGRRKHKGNQKLAGSKNNLKYYSAKCVQRYPRKIIITTFIVFLSGFLISGIIGFNGTGEISTDWIRRWIPGDLKVEDLHMQNLADSDTSGHETFNSSVLEKILFTEGVARADSMQVNSNFLKININSMNKDSDLYRMHEAEFANNSEYENETISSDNTMQLCNIYGVDKIEKYSGTGNVNTEGVIIDSQLADFLNLKVNDKIQIVTDIENQVTELPVSYIFQEEFPLSHTSEGFSSVLMSLKTMKIITGRDTIDRIDVWLNQGMDENVVKQQLQSIQEISDIGTITTFNDYASDFYKEQNTQQSLLIIVAAAFFTIMLVTCFNAIANNFADRGRETAVIYVVGIDKASIMKAHLREGFYCVIGGFLLIILSQIVILLFGQSFFEINFFIFVVYAVLDVCIMLFCMFSTFGCAKKLTRGISLSDLQYE